ncbi:MAG: DNA-binding protein [Crocinitomicaceae bacterium]|nr:DNA-binding protein [Crocinitomicaceae bacterium]|tara:strand:+ start:771 stop:1148 length:378 start_codon:yes stop_codon:yes gene_type:complete
MEEGNGNNNYRDEIYSKSVRAGKRTYFFDVKSTRGGDYYLTITESKKRFQQDGSFHFEKHKLFLYKEDFEKFSDGLDEVVAKIQELNNSSDDSSSISQNNDSENDVSNENMSEDGNFKDVDFDDL